MTTSTSPRLLLASALLGLCTAAQVSAAPITIDASNVASDGHDASVGSFFDSDTSTAYGSRSVSAAIGPTASSTTFINWTDTGAGAFLDFDFDHVRAGGAGSYSRSYESVLYFTVGASDTTYELSGQYSMTGDQRILSDTRLVDTVTGGSVFRDYNYSDNTPNESFTLGDVGDGDAGNINGGSLTGTLLAGRQYYLFFQNYINAHDVSDSGASATGCLSLSIGGATGGGECGSAAVEAPAPAPLALLALGIAFMGMRRAR